MYRVFYYLQRLQCLLTVTYYDMLAIDEARRPVPIWGSRASLEQFAFHLNFFLKRSTIYLNLLVYIRL